VSSFGTLTAFLATMGIGDFGFWQCLDEPAESSDVWLRLIFVDDTKTTTGG
jgi:hypothetical protein